MNHARANMPGDDPPLVWTEDFSVGNAQLDADHQVLFAIVAGLAGEPEPVPPQLLRDVLDSLIDYAESHFAREEAHQEAMGFPGLPAHREQHQYLTGRLLALRAHCAADPRRLDIVELRRFLRGWLINHVLHEDMRYRWYEEEGAPED